MPKKQTKHKNRLDLQENKKKIKEGRRQEEEEEGNKERIVNIA